MSVNLYYTQRIRGFQQHSVKYTPSSVCFTLRRTKFRCKRCGSSDLTVTPLSLRRVHGEPMGSCREVVFEFTTHRLYCPNCKVRAVEHIPFLSHPHARMTKALGCVVNRFVLYYANVKKRISGKWRMHTNDMIYRMNLGLKSNFCYRGARELGAATLATTGNLSMRYFGFYERGHLGVICHRVTEIGKILTGVFAVGVTKEFGRNYCRN